MLKIVKTENNFIIMFNMEKNISTISNENVILDNQEFSEYEKKCNDNSLCYRKEGIILESLYDSVVNSDRTLFLNSNKKNIPVFITIENAYALGYDSSRCEKMANNDENTYFLCTPVESLNREELVDFNNNLKKIKGYLYFSETDERTSELINGLAKENDQQVQEIEMHDDICLKGCEQASLSLYEFDIEQKDDQKISSKAVTLRQIENYFEANNVNKNDPDRCVIINGSKLEDDQIRNMWNLYQAQFQFLGEKHPISMEDDIEDWLNVITSKDTTLTIKYENNEIVCFADFTENFDDLYWLNKNYLNSLKLPNQTNVFVPGIVSNASGKCYAGEVVKTFTQNAAELGAEGKVLFENTNRSERYIPIITKRSLRSIEQIKVSDIKKINEVKYRLFKID